MIKKALKKLIGNKKEKKKTSLNKPIKKLNDKKPDYTYQLFKELLKNTNTN